MGDHEVPEFYHPPPPRQVPSPREPEREQVPQPSVPAPPQGRNQFIGLDVDKTVTVQTANVNMPANLPEVPEGGRVVNVHVGEQFRADVLNIN